MAVVLLNDPQSYNKGEIMSAGHLQNQLTRSLERILEDAHLSGELKLSGRKLKDFPKVAGKYNLNDTVIADLSRNRFGELPEEVTTFAFLDTLFAFHNAIRSIPETIRGLQSLQYLDIRNNQLTALPREICYLPLQVLLVSNNRLTSLPDEVHKMTLLTELDAACNQISHLPARIGDLVCLRSLSLRSNLLMFLPRELTNLQLVTLDISCNKIAALPLELRLMTSLVNLELDNNPLTSPPASLCVRGLVHVFKYLETLAAKEDKLTRPYDGGTLRRGQVKATKTMSDTTDYRTSDDNVMKPVYIRPEFSSVASSGVSTPSTLSPNVENVITDNLVTDPFKIKLGLSGATNSTDVSPEGGDLNKTRMLGGIQTYREYKEALRQQRNQDSNAIYRPKEQQSPGDSPASSNKSQTSTPSPTIFSSNQSSPMSPSHAINEAILKKPIQKVIPSRNINGNHQQHPVSNGNYDGYIKPNSPLKVTTPSKVTTPTTGVLKNGNMSQRKPAGTTNGKSQNVSWNRDISVADKLSFTMRREIDKQKEESELIEQLRALIETKLKMTLPEDMSTALTDGVVLCHLANHVRPRSVASIHVPSPTVPKLTMARCRKNVDNFIEACKKIGVDQELICSCNDIVPTSEDENSSSSSSPRQCPNPTKMYQTIDALFQFHHEQQQQEQLQRQQRADQSQRQNHEKIINNHHHHNLNNNSVYNATNTNNTLQGKKEDNFFNNFSNKSKRCAKNNNYDDDDEDDDDVSSSCSSNSKKNNSISRSGSSKTVPNSLDLTRENKSKISRVKKTFNETFQLNGIVEECEYDSDIGKFSCTNFSDVDITSSEPASSVATPVTTTTGGGGGANHGGGTSSSSSYSDLANNMDSDDNGVVGRKIVMKHIEFFENNLGRGGDDKILNGDGNLDNFGRQDSMIDGGKPSENFLTSVCLLGVFLSTILILFLFPLPN